MFALPPKADMVQRGCDVRFVPKADISTSHSQCKFAATPMRPAKNRYKIAVLKRTPLSKEIFGPLISGHFGVSELPLGLFAAMAGLPRSTGGNAFIQNNEIWFADGLTNSH